MVGGATTSEMHAALKIAPAYSGPVVWVKDAAQNVVVLARLLNAEECPNYVRQLESRYQTLRQNYHSEQHKLATIGEARNNKLDLF